MDYEATLLSFLFCLLLKSRLRLTARRYAYALTPLYTYFTTLLYLDYLSQSRLGLHFIQWRRRIVMLTFLHSLRFRRLMHYETIALTLPHDLDERPQYVVFAKPCLLSLHSVCFCFPLLLALLLHTLHLLSPYLLYSL